MFKEGDLITFYKKDVGSSCGYLWEDIYAQIISLGNPYVGKKLDCYNKYSLAYIFTKKGEFVEIAEGLNFCTEPHKWVFYKNYGRGIKPKWL